MMAQNKFNVLSLWQLEPWQYLIKPRHFPKASLPHDELLLWRKLYGYIFKGSRDRGIEPYIVNWNIFVSQRFQMAYDANATSDAEGPDPEPQTPSPSLSLTLIEGPGPGNGCLDEAVKVYNRESITQVIDEYEDLAGVGLTFGDRMKEMTTTEQVQWVEETFFAGIKAATRPAKLIYRAELKAGVEDVEIARKSVEKSGLLGA